MNLAAYVHSPSDGDAALPSPRAVADCCGAIDELGLGLELDKYRVCIYSMGYSMGYSYGFLIYLFIR
jgi:hypothetical protein